MSPRVRVHILIEWSPFSRVHAYWRYTSPPRHIALHSPLLSRITCARRERVVAGGRAALDAGDEGQGRAGHGGTRGGRGRAPRGHREPQGRDAGLGTVCVAGRCEAVCVCDTTRVRKASVGAREGRALRACRARAWRRPLRTRRPRAPSPCPLQFAHCSCCCTNKMVNAQA